jgi:hypothetical protein
LERDIPESSFESSNLMKSFKKNDQKDESAEMDEAEFIIDSRQRRHDKDEGSDERVQKAQHTKVFLKHDLSKRGTPSPAAKDKVPSTLYV